MKSLKYPWSEHQFTGDIMKCLFTRTNCHQNCCTSLMLTTIIIIIENGWQDTTNRRKIHKIKKVSIQTVDSLIFSIFSVLISFQSHIFFVFGFLLTTTIIGYIRCIRVHSTRSTNFVYEWFHTGMGNDLNIRYIQQIVYCVCFATVYTNLQLDIFVNIKSK